MRRCRGEPGEEKMGAKKLEKLEKMGAKKFLGRICLSSFLLSLLLAKSGQ